MDRVIFRADGNSEIGLGHVMRSLALVEMLKTEFECVFAIHNPSKQLVEVIGTFCDSIIYVDKASETESFFGHLAGSELVVLDGYHFDSKYRSGLKKRVRKLVLIDDTAEDYSDADMVINHCLRAGADIYRGIPAEFTLLGFKYALIRKSFRRAARNERKLGKVDTAFICLGGSDYRNVTEKVLEACMEIEFIKTINIVTGSAYPHYAQLMKKTATAIGKTIRHYNNIPEKEMVELITSSQIALSSASSIAIEICSVRTGLIAGISADNQNFIYDNLLHNGYCMPIGNWNEVSIDEVINAIQTLETIDIIERMMAKQLKGIDGLSGERILDKFKELSQC